VQKYVCPLDFHAYQADLATLHSSCAEPFPGTVFGYEVTTVELLPADAGSLEAVTAESGDETLTLITCGGDWDPASQHYLHRTVVQATRIA
jgi:hypothetical protein